MTAAPPASQPPALRAAPVLRAILLGASNLKASLPWIVDSLRRRAGGPVEVLAACGHGRSYGEVSRFLFVRRLPGIESCGLWRALEERPGFPAVPTVALVTDVGNDLAYGEPLERIAGWVATCLARLSRREAVTVLTLLPLASLERLSPLRYTLARSVLFPGRDVPWDTLLDRARRLDGVLRRLGRDWKANVVEPQAAWYGLDPVHLRRGARRAVWGKALDPWWETLPGTAKAGPGLRRWRVPVFGAEQYRLLRKERQTVQPALRFADGSTVELY